MTHIWLHFFLFSCSRRIDIDERRFCWSNFLELRRPCEPENSELLSKFAAPKHQQRHKEKNRYGKRIGICNKQ